MMNSQEIDPITELKQRGGDLRARPVRFDIDGLHVDIGEGEPAATLSMSQEALVRLLRKETDSTTLFMTGDLKITGDMSAAVAFGQAFERGAESSLTDSPVERPAVENETIDYLDNIALIVFDLQETYNQYTNLGFNLADRGTHYYEKPAGVFTKWGTANHCVNFRDGGLLEFIAHYYPEHPAGLYGDQLKKFGNHWGKVTLHCRSNDAEVSRLRRQDVAVADPSILYRYTDGETFKPEPGHSKRTSLFSYPMSFEGGFMTLGGEHTLGEFPISEDHFNHPNGAARLSFALIGASDPQTTAERYARALSIAAEQTDAGWRIHLGRETFLYFAGPSRLPAALADELAGRDAALVGAGFEAPDMNATRAFLARRDVALSETDFGLAALRPINGSGAVFFSEKLPV